MSIGDKVRLTAASRPDDRPPLTGVVCELATGPQGQADVRVVWEDGNPYVWNEAHTLERV